MGLSRKWIEELESNEINYSVVLKRTVTEIWTKCYENKKNGTTNSAWQDLERHHHITSRKDLLRRLLPHERCGRQWRGNENKGEGF